MLFILLIKLFLLWQLGDLLVDSSVPLTWPHYSILLFFSFNNSLLSGTTRTASLILYIPYPSPRLTISPRSHGSFYYDKSDTETKM